MHHIHYVAKIYEAPRTTKPCIIKVISVSFKNYTL